MKTTKSRKPRTSKKDSKPESSSAQQNIDINTLGIDEVNRLLSETEKQKTLLQNQWNSVIQQRELLLNRKVQILEESPPIGKVEKVVPTKGEKVDN